MIDTMHTPDERSAPSPDVVDGELAAIIGEWEQLTSEEPWHVDPHRYGADTLHATIRAVLDMAVWGGTDPFAPERLVRTAAAHGDQRRTQGARSDELLAEYHALRGAFWRFLKRESGGGPEAIAQILRTDVALGIATTVALRGYHRSETPAGTSWESVMLRQVSEASLRLVDELPVGRSS